MTRTADVLIVGAGHAGAACAIALRQGGFVGSVLIVGDEPELPYDRPPLSKDYLAGEKPFERLLIRPPAFWTERNIDIATNTRVVAVDAAAHSVATAAGDVIGYRHLVWATGGTPRPLDCPSHALAGVHTVRNRADIDRMTSELATANEVVVIGGGYIGLEAAAVLTKLGRRVTVLEAMDRVLARVAGEPLSRFIEGQHRAHGVDIRLEAAVDCLVGDTRVRSVRMRDGTSIAADMVIVGIGITPAVEPLVAAGAATGNGVWVDAGCRTSLPDIFAVGDCAAHHNAFANGDVIRLESVQNAADQGALAARNIMGANLSYGATPWFWSNQFDIKLQTVGLSARHDECLVRGDPDSGRFSLIYLRANRVIALDCVNSVKDYVQGRALVEAGTQLDRALACDSSIPLKSAVRPDALD